MSPEKPKFKQTPQIERYIKNITNYWNECLKNEVPRNKIQFEEPLKIKTFLKTEERGVTREDDNSREAFMKWAESIKAINIVEYNYETATCEHAQLAGEDTFIEFPEYFYINVLDIEPFLELQNKYISNEITDKFPTHYDNLTKVIKSPELESHYFRTGGINSNKTLEIFKRLWDNRQHTVSNNPKLKKIGKPDSFINFIRQLELIKTGLELNRNDKKKKLLQKIKNVTKPLFLKKYPISLTCNENEILLIIRD